MNILPVIKRFLKKIDRCNSSIISHYNYLLLSEIMGKNKKKHNSDDNKFDKKSTSIAHAIISAVKPRSFLSSLQLGLSVRTK
jgi:hypothetical protein